MIDINLRSLKLAKKNAELTNALGFLVALK
jgi:hypothetical protein